MFTGIIEYLGKVKQVKLQVDSAIIVVDIGPLSDDASLGDSIAVNGTCLTVTQTKGSDVYFDVSAETLKLTAIGKLKTSDKVNIERSLKMGDQLGGHFVTGHVDGVGTINKVENKPGQCTVWFSVSKELANMMMKKGSVAIDGISLTIVEIREGLFSVALIPYTLEATSLGFKKAGEQVNIETDMLGKWVKRILTTNDSTTSGITEEMLKKKGFL